MTSGPGPKVALKWTRRNSSLSALSELQVAADGSHVYWSWGGVDGSLSYTGRADANGTHIDPRFLPDSLYPMALAG